MSELYERYLNTKKDEPARSPVAKDRDRIVHSSALRRLQGKSQIMTAAVSDYFRTRLTHSLECAQIGRAIARRVTDGRDEVVEEADHFEDLVEAACLAHDFGHPPFGHNGERALRDCMEDKSHKLFEGNAQSFRIATYLEPKVIGEVSPDYDRWVGLNLTRTTLQAICKYPRIETAAMRAEKHPKFSIYDDSKDREVSDWIWAGVKPERTLATRIMDIADDIAYAAHDFEDGVWAGMIPLFDLLAGDEQAIELLRKKIAERDATVTTKGVAEDLDALFRESAAEAGFEHEHMAWARRPFEQTRQNVSYLKGLSAALIGIFIDAVVIDGVFHEPPEHVRRRIDALTGIAWVWMIERPELATVQFGQRRLIQELFNAYWEEPGTLPRPEEVGEIEGMLLPDGTWPEKARLICDHIAGMTDIYAVHAHRQMYAGEAAFRLRYTR